MLMCEKEEKPPHQVDELLAVLGDKVRSSDMAEVTQKLEQLRIVLGNAQDVPGSLQDLRSLLLSMTSEINPSPRNQNSDLHLPIDDPIAAVESINLGDLSKAIIYLSEDLMRRIFQLYLQDSLDSFSFFYLKFAHFTANQAILDAFEGEEDVHVIDLSMKQGIQWVALIKALALRPGGPPKFRLTAIGPREEALQQVGLRLTTLADTYHIQFQYRGMVANSLADINVAELNLLPIEFEATAVNSVFELHKLLALPGAIEKVLNSIKAMTPKVVTIVEQEANENGLVFLDRFTESLHCYSTQSDSREGCSREDEMIWEFFAEWQQKDNFVERVELRETLSQWQVRMGMAEFSPVHFGSNALNHASRLLTSCVGGGAYRVEENEGCLMLRWHTRPLVATSAWRLGPINDSISVQEKAV